MFWPLKPLKHLNNFGYETDAHKKWLRLRVRNTLACSHAQFLARKTDEKR